MKLSIATYANPEIIAAITSHVKQLNGLELEASYPITDLLKTDGIDLNETTFAIEMLEKAVADIGTPNFHNLGIALFEAETCYGEALGYAVKSSSGNTMFLAVCDYEDEDPIIVLAYDGTRGGLDYLACGNSPMKASYLKALVNNPEYDILVYETNGPKDMYFWECKAEYVERVRGNAEINAVKAAVKILATSGELGVIAYGKMVADEPVLTHYYVTASNLGMNDNHILSGWINVDDEVVRDARAQHVKNIITAHMLANQLLEAL